MKLLHEANIFDEVSSYAKIEIIDLEKAAIDTLNVRVSQIYGIVKHVVSDGTLGDVVKTFGNRCVGSFVALTVAPEIIPRSVCIITSITYDEYIQSSPEESIVSVSSRCKENIS